MFCHNYRSIGAHFYLGLHCVRLVKRNSAKFFDFIFLFRVNLGEVLALEQSRERSSVIIVCSKD